jgi:hypothetical protein
MGNNDPADRSGAGELSRRSFLKFWTTLPGVLTGTATLIGAIVAVFIAIDAQRDKTQEPTAGNGSSEAASGEVPPATTGTTETEMAIATASAPSDPFECVAFPSRWLDGQQTAGITSHVELELYRDAKGASRAVLTNSVGVQRGLLVTLVAATPGN